MQEYKKILIIRFSSLGDIIVTTPLLRVLKQKFPSSTVDFLTKHQYKEILQNNPNVDNVFTIPDNADFNELKQIIPKIRNNTYDLVIDAHNNLRTFYIRRKIHGVKFIKFKKYSLRKFLLVHFKFNLMKNLPPIATRYLRILEKAGIDIKDSANLPEIYVNDENQKEAEKIITSIKIDRGNLKLICIIPSAKHFTKTYPPENYGKLMDLFGSSYYFLIAGLSEDKSIIEKVAQNTKSNYKILIDLKLGVFAEVMKRCNAVICGDTGPMHIAEALNVPLIAIFGSTVKEFGFYPNSENSVVIENKELGCRPCTHIGRSSCPLGHFKCMKEIEISNIKNQILKIL